MGFSRQSNREEENYFNNKSFSKQRNKSFYEELHLAFVHFLKIKLIYVFCEEILRTFQNHNWLILT